MDFQFLFLPIKLNSFQAYQYEYNKGICSFKVKKYFLQQHLLEKKIQIMQIK